MYFKVVTWNTKTDRIFDTWDQAYDYIIMNDEGDWWYIERLRRRLTSHEHKIHCISMKEIVEHRSIMVDSLKQLGIPSSDP